MQEFQSIFQEFDLVDFRNILIIVSVCLGVLFSLFVFFSLSPVVGIDTELRRLTDNHSVVEVQLSNKSKVRVRIKKSENNSQFGVLLQAFSHDVESVVEIPDFLPFSEEWHTKVNYPANWKGPLPIMTSTEWIYPNEVIVAEFLVSHEMGKILHFGIQVHAEFGWFEATRLRKPAQRWTSVRFFSDRET